MWPLRCLSGASGCLSNASTSKGNTTTLDQVVRRQFRTVEGDPLNPSRHSSGRQTASARLASLLGCVKVDGAIRGRMADQTVVKVEVAEQPTGSLSFGATYGVASGHWPERSGFSSEPNFLGRGQAIDLSLNITSGTDSATWTAPSTFTDPSFLGRDVKLLKFCCRLHPQTTHDKRVNYDTSNISCLSPSHWTFPRQPGIRRLKLRLKFDPGHD